MPEPMPGAEGADTAVHGFSLQKKGLAKHASIHNVEE
jgi:hypothetical protein